jgi:hypothetical protein
VLCSWAESNAMIALAPDEYEKLPLEEKEHYAECSECGEIFDRRSLDEVMFHHADHKHPPDI